MSPEDFRRLKTLDAIVPPARPAFDALIAYATARGFQPYIVSAVRTCREEASLTSTRVRRSWHILGRAVDVELHARGQASTLVDAYAELGEWWEQQGGTWGGRWVTLYPVPHPEGWCGPPDMPGDPCHFQFTDGQETVPESVWPKTVTACTDVDRLQAAYFASQGSLAPVSGPSSPGGALPGVPGSSPLSGAPTRSKKAGAVAAVAAGVVALVVLGRRKGGPGWRRA